MWVGGVRTIIQREDGRILLVCQRHEGRNIWMPPGGAMEMGELAHQTAVREVNEETGLEVQLHELIWHCEGITSSGEQRFANYFRAEISGGHLKLGNDPEFDEDNQVLQDLGFFSKEELMKLEHVYPREMRDEIWDYLESGCGCHNVYRLKENGGR